jgi:succinyl-CoA synthetase beta subunit
MARLHEYQGKAILAANGFKIPRGAIDFDLKDCR